MILGYVLTVLASVYISGFILMLVAALDDEWWQRVLRAALWPLVLIYGWLVL